MSLTLEHVLRTDVGPRIMRYVGWMHAYSADELKEAALKHTKSRFSKITVITDNMGRSSNYINKVRPITLMYFNPWTNAT